MIIDVLVTASISLTLQAVNTFTIFNNELHQANTPFNVISTDRFLVTNVDAISLADAQLKVKARGNAMAIAFQQKRGMQYQNQNASINGATMNVAANWDCTLLYSPAPQRTDPTIILT